MPVRQLWERFIGGDIAYAPASLRVDPASPDYAAFRRKLTVPNADLFDVAHQRLQGSLTETELATWTPLSSPSGLT